MRIIFKRLMARLISAQVALKKMRARGVPPAPSIPRVVAPAPQCWCGHYMKNHLAKSDDQHHLIKNGCQVWDCPCEKAMDPSITLCTYCCQHHAQKDSCPMPDPTIPRVVDGVSQGVMVNFKPAKDQK